MKPSDFISDETMTRTFFTSALVGMGAVVLPVLGPPAIAGMVASQAIFWGKRLAGEDSTDKN